jgi:hypothetical protein
MDLASRRARELAAPVWVTSGPPSLLVAALRWQRRRPFPLVADFRDVWPESPGLQAVKASWTLALIRSLERRVLRRAALVTTVSTPWVSLFESKGASRCLEVSNGFDPSDRPTGVVREPSGPVDELLPVAYAGRLESGRRNTAALESALRLLPDTHAFVYYGPDEDRFAEVAGSLGARARYGGQLPLGELLGELSVSTGLVAVGGEGDTWEARGAVPAKIYEYMLTERPILYIGAPDHEAARRVARYPRGHVLDSTADGDAQAAVVSGFVNDGADPGGLDPEARRGLEAVWGYPYLAGRLAEAVRSLGDGR